LKENTKSPIHQNCVKNKLTQGDIAKVLGISYQAYQRLEKPGKCNPTLKTLKRLAKVFNKNLRLEFAFTGSNN
jgi:DNA-binding XRE family transcriptional regulator